MVTTDREHMVSSYEEELRTLAGLVADMASLVGTAVGEAVSAMASNDVESAAAVVKGDKAVDELQHELDNLAVSIIARRQPVASDLRLIVSSIHVANDLERIGDMAKSIARRCADINPVGGVAPHISSLKQMADIATRQIAMAYDAFSTRNEASAIAVLEHDVEIDAAYVAIFRELLTYMMEDPRNISVCTHLLFCAKSLERVGDHATNIAEQAYFLATGKDLASEEDKVNRRQIRG